MCFKIGSLFDGSGGFPLAAAMCGGVPTWASEVEPYPIAVTRSRFPNMIHLGDISKINGAEIAPVDVITFGSPCQDLSVAGKRAGLKHEDNGDDETTRSGLFMEAVRIIKEMRANDKASGRTAHMVRPRFALWENVPGAFSSNGGEDFRTVLQELIKIVEPEAPEVPAPDKNGWPYADCIVGDGWSLAWRTFDAQYWGVPQRRRRIHLVVDFAGECAGEILFERESLRGYFAEGRAPRQGAAADAQGSSGADDREGIGVIPYTLKIRSGCEGGGKGALIQEDLSATLATNNDQYLFQPVAYSFDSLASNSMKSKNPHSGCREVEVAKTLDTTDPNPSKNQGGIAVVDQVIDCHILDDQGGQQIGVRTDGKSPTLRAEMHGNVPCVMQAAGFKAGQGVKAHGIGWEEERAPTLASEAGGNSVPSVCAVLASSAENAEITDGKISPCLMARAGTGGNQLPLIAAIEPLCIPIQDQATRYSGKRGDKSDGKGNGLGIGNDGDPMSTLTSGDRHAVCYAMQAFGKYTESDTASAMKARDYKDATDLVCECAGVDCRNATEYPELNGTLQAKGGGGFCLNCNQVVRVRYIVRRLTPTECARLQGFPDEWGHPDHKADFSNEEYRFWMEVRNTHAGINGKAVKEYTKEQMLKWYNGLHTDSAEYKMWGNGIALPPALYVMQGIAEVLRKEESDG